MVSKATALSSQDSVQVTLVYSISVLLGFFYFSFSTIFNDEKY